VNTRKSWHPGCTKKGVTFPRFPGLRDFPGFFEISPGFRGEKSFMFSWFQAVIVCIDSNNGGCFWENLWDFPEFLEISGNFLTMSGISPGFRGENSGVFSRFQAVIVYKPLKNG
jgi:hypothetical protein